MSTKFGRSANNNDSSIRKRYVARVKNVCMAIPFNPSSTLLSFQKESILRASSHRKLKKESSLSHRIKFIKLATPHFPQLIDCYGDDLLCEIATEEDIIVFQTASDDEKEDPIYEYKVNTNNKVITPKSKKKNKKDSKSKDKSAKTSTTNPYVKGPNTPTPSLRLKYKAKDNNGKKKRNSAGLIDSSLSSTPKIKPLKTIKTKKKKHKNHLSSDLNRKRNIKSKSGTDLHINNEERERDSDDSVRSGYSGHSDRDEDDEDKKDEIAAFAAEILSAGKKTSKRDYDLEEEEARISRKKRASSSHGRSISLSGVALLHSGDSKKKRTKKKSKNTESIYASNVQSKSSKANKRSNAFEFFAGNNNKNKNKMSISQEKRKRKYRYGNRNINVIRSSVVPYSEEQEQKPEYYLDLKYIHGYNGYNQRQNLFLSHDNSSLIYPMARTGIVLNLNSNTQRHWMDGREAISSICLHPSAPIIVTGHVQKGPDRAIIRVWNYKTMVLHKLIKKVHDAAVLCCSWSSVSGYLYTIGAQEMHKCVLWNGSDLFKLDLKHGNTVADGIDHEDILIADYESKKKNFINCSIDIVSDILLGKQDILGFELNPFIDNSSDAELIDEFVCFGKKNVKYYEVKKRNERRNGRNVELVLPSAKTIVMGKLGSKSSEYERCYNCCLWLSHAPSYYLLGGHQGTIYICYKASCLKKVTNLGFEAQIGCMLRCKNMNAVYVSCWDGKLSVLNTQQITNLKLKKENERMVYVPRSGDEESGLKTWSARCMLYHPLRDKLYIGLRTNQIISIDVNNNNNDKLSGIELVLDSHYGNVRCLAAHPFEPYFVTGSDDSTLRIWDIHNFECLTRFKFDEKEKPSCLRFSHTGYLLAVGLTTSKIVILAWRNCNLSQVKAVIKMPFKIDKKLKRSQQMDAKNSEFTTDITVIKWSADDLSFAAGHIDAIAHIFSVKYVDIADPFDDELTIIPWHHSLDVSNGLIDIQWSKDNQWLLTFTKDQDLMVWFLNRDEMIFEHYLYWLDPDKISFHGDPLLAGWDVEGVFQSYVGWDGTDLNAVSLTNNEYNKTSPIDDYDLINKQKQQTKCKLLATADNKGYIRLHNYPALNEAAHHAYSGHANQVKQVQWSANDQYLISVGGSDRSVFQWKLTDKVTDYIKKYKPLKSANPFKK